MILDFENLAKFWHSHKTFISMEHWIYIRSYSGKGLCFFTFHIFPLLCSPVYQSSGYLAVICLNTNLLRLSCKNCVKNIWASVFFWTCFHTFLFPTPKKNLMLYETQSWFKPSTLIFDIFEQRSFVWKFTSDCKFAINYWCCILTHHYYTCIFWVN